MKERRVKVGVELPVVVRRLIERRLMPAHGVRKRDAEQGVVLTEEGDQTAPQGSPLTPVQVGRRPTGRLGTSRISKGQAAQNGTTTSHSGSATTSRTPPVSCTAYASRRRRPVASKCLR